MRSTSRGAGILVALSTLALPLAAGDCGRTACITVSQAGACPSPEAALARFSSPTCPGPITAVDGPGEKDGALCCYPVEIDDGPSQPCATGGAPVGNPVTSVVGSSTSFTSTGSSSGDCATCRQALQGTPFTQTCGDARTSLQSLEMCACTTACVTSCDANFCIGNTYDADCFDCLTTSCAGEFQNCQDN